jgi:CheY-like chemotaxis protein
MAKILIVDDDPDFQRINRKILEREGHEVTTAANGDEALELLRDYKPDLMLLDVMMSWTLEGIDVCRTIRSEPELEHMPIIMISSIATSEYAAEFPDDESIPIDGWISKPIQPTVLVRAVNRFLPSSAEKS